MATAPKETRASARQDARGTAASIYVIDPHLRDGVGHYLDYALSIAREAAQRGERFVAFGARDVTAAVQDRIAVVPTFDALHDSAPSRWRLVHALRVASNLVTQSLAIYRALRRATVGIEDVRATYFFPNASTLDIVGYALWVASRARRTGTSYVVLLRYDHHTRGRHPWVLSAWLRIAFWLLRWRQPSGTVRLASDSAPLARLFGRLSGDMPEVLPIPHTPDITNAPRGRPKPGAALRGCQFVYLGGWRSEQGVADLTEALLQLRTEFERGRFTALIQANPRPSDRDACRMRDRLRDAALPGVELVEEVLTRERFVSSLLAADVVLVPYSSDAYRYRTSGIFAEAVALGKPVITTRGSWMSDGMDAETALLFESGNAVEFAAVMRVAASKLDALSDAAAERRGSWTDFHNPTRFYDLLTRSAGPAGGDGL